MEILSNQQSIHSQTPKIAPQNLVTSYSGANVQKLSNNPQQSWTACNQLFNKPLGIANVASSSAFLSVNQSSSPSVSPRQTVQKQRFLYNNANGSENATFSPQDFHKHLNFLLKKNLPSTTVNSNNLHVPEKNKAIFINNSPGIEGNPAISSNNSLAKEVKPACGVVSGPDCPPKLEAKQELGIEAHNSFSSPQQPRPQPDPSQPLKKLSLEELQEAKKSLIEKLRQIKKDFKARIEMVEKEIKEREGKAIKFVPFTLSSSKPRVSLDFPKEVANPSELLDLKTWGTYDAGQRIAYLQTRIISKRPLKPNQKVIWSPSETRKN